VTHTQPCRPALRTLARSARLAPLATLTLLTVLTHALPSARAHAASPDGADAMRPSREQPVALITGSTDGLGREVALRVAETGVHVIVHGRNRARGEAVVAEIRDAGGSASFHAADLASLAEVRRLGETILREYDRLDLLVNNAGIWLRSGTQRELSVDGHELHFAVNYLSGYLLTRLLLPRLIESAPARIVNVASTAQTPIDFDDVMLERGYGGGRAYGQSKLAQILCTMDLAEELEDTGVIATSLHPATLMDTPMVHAAGVEPRSTVEEGARAVMNVITSPEIRSGDYFSGMRRAEPNAQALDREARAQLRALSHHLTNAP
jgi:NAD(P)-dependent dehydrogenase (short-subunit alcohol dehydrogenase family)